MQRTISILVVGAIAVTALAQSKPEQVSRSESLRRTVTGPSGPMNEAIASGATVTVTLQPVAPKTVPASNYPPGSSIVGSTLTLGSVPARVWLEGHITGWAPDVLKTAQIAVSGNDPEQDGGGFSGASATCAGQPVSGAGDITPARQACNLNADCRPTMSGISSPCFAGEPCRCTTWDGMSPAPYFPPGRWCEPAFQDLCDGQWFGVGIPFTCGVDIGTVNFRFGVSTEPGEIPTDFAPTYIATIVLDVPANAKGTYTLDLWEQSTFMFNPNPPEANNIPIAALNPAVIHVVSCTTNSQCNDGDACTEDVCEGGCCTNLPVVGWNLETECCNPASGAQGAIPASTPCRIGGCSLGGSHGVPTITNRPDGESCESIDPCMTDGECASGVCVGEQYAGSDCPKPRFISFDLDPGATPKAYRIRMVSLHHPQPLYSGGVTADFSAFEGQYRWVGPPTTYAESSTNLTPVHAALVGCDPHFQDWSPIQLLHVTGPEVVPSSTYEVQSIEVGLDIGNEANYSAPVSIDTARWGDVGIAFAPPSQTEQPDFSDISALVDKFKSTPTSISKPRALLVGSDAGGTPDLTFDVDFAEISMANDAFKGRAYPYAGPQPCP